MPFRAERVAARAALHALVIDDDRFMLDFVSGLLQELGLGRIEGAAGGACGVRAFDLARPKPDLVLVDLHMPGHDGFALLAALAERRYDGGVILLSGQEDRLLHAAGQLARFHQLQVLAALAKPVGLAALAEAIGRLN
ncbi:MAG: response regulator [Pseudomonadota bacterium]